MNKYLTNLEELGGIVNKMKFYWFHNVVVGCPWGRYWWIVFLYYSLVISLSVTNTNNDT